MKSLPASIPAMFALCVVSHLTFASDPTVRAIVLNGDSVPGFPGYSFPNGLGYTASINSAGQIAFTCGFSGTPALSGILFDANPGLTLIASSGSPAPGGGTFPALGGTAAYSGDNASTSFFTTLTDARVALYTINQVGQLQVIARDGDPSPTALPGVYRFINGASVSWNSLGRAAFISGIDAGAGVTFTALMAATTTGGAMAARTRPNTSETGFTSFGTEIRVNNDFEMGINGVVAGQTSFTGL